MTTWLVTATYDSAWGERRDPGPQPVTKAQLENAGQSNSVSSWTVSVEADDEAEAIQEAQPLLAWAASQRSMPGTPELTAKDREVARAEFAALLASLPEPSENPEPAVPGARRYALM